MEKEPIEKIEIMAKEVGLSLNREQLEELADAWSHVKPMIARLQGRWGRKDEPAHIFRPTAFSEGQQHDK